jgi:SpoVK/Ycf46/Vps4 family AAA+-type ATPase
MANANCRLIFAVTENRDWILFFDEADALFGKRTSIGTSNDRFANQETAYLLQRIEVCRNIVILATNLKSNLDEAFTRRFQSIVYFPTPTEGERLQLWQGAFAAQVTLEKPIDLAVTCRRLDRQCGPVYHFDGGSERDAANHLCRFDGRVATGICEVGADIVRKQVWGRSRAAVENALAKASGCHKFFAKLDRTWRNCSEFKDIELKGLTRGGNEFAGSPPCNRRDQQRLW